MLKIDKNNIARIRDSICRTCTFAETCVNFEKSDGAIFECDSFQESTRDLYCEYADCGKEMVQEDFQTPQGLCQSCKHLKNCLYTEEGQFKWHCEHYE